MIPQMNIAVYFVYWIPFAWVSNLTSRIFAKFQQVPLLDLTFFSRTSYWFILEKIFLWVLHIVSTYYQRRFLYAMIVSNIFMKITAKNIYSTNKDNATDVYVPTSIIDGTTRLLCLLPVRTTFCCIHHTHQLFLELFAPKSTCLDKFKFSIVWLCSI